MEPCAPRLRLTLCILEVGDHRLTGLQPETHGESRRRAFAFGWAGSVCLALLALLITVQVAHNHVTENDANHCSLCIAMHSAAPVAVVIAAIVMIWMGSSEPLAEARAVVRYWNPKLFTRPPPLGR